MNGATQYETKQIAKIRALAKTDLAAAKKLAIKFKYANRNRVLFREMLLRTVKYLHSHFEEK